MVDPHTQAHLAARLPENTGASAPFRAWRGRGATCPFPESCEGRWGERGPEHRPLETGSSWQVIPSGGIGNAEAEAQP